MIDCIPSLLISFSIILNNIEGVKYFFGVKGGCVEVRICTVCRTQSDITTSLRIIPNGRVVVKLWYLKCMI